MSDPHGTKELLVAIFSAEEVQAYERVKRGSMVLASELERELILLVDGRRGERGEGCDAVTRLGKWEFCVQWNTKNKAGKAADEARCPGHCVQILGRPNPGWISGSEFLTRHGVASSRIADAIEAACASTIATIPWQMRIAV